MRKFLLILLLISSASEAFSQLNLLKGTVRDEKGVSLGYAPVVLLNPIDSTLAFFSVTDANGYFEIKGVRNGKYILQATLMGHKPFFSVVSIPFNITGDIGSLVLNSAPISLKEVVVAEEHTPMSFKRDTVEYNTAAYVTKPDAVVEDLLKKLPGIEVDRAGNIKAMGEDVKKVLVDGREFFGSDPKLATRNVPADALKKVQVYDKKSDESEFTGIDDGTRDKTLNLQLKENRKNALFGELMTGGGSESHYLGSGKVYKFTGKNQFAALGMINNINQFGFSFKDYIDFNGGVQNFAGHGGNVQIRLPGSGNSSFPVNFGQPVTGLSTSGASGFNFSTVYKKDSRVFMSYIANGSDRNLNQSTFSRNYTDSESFLQEDSLKERKSDRVHRLNFGLRNRIDSSQNIIINGGASLSSGRIRSNSGGKIFNDDSQRNVMSSDRTDRANRFTGNIDGSYLKLINKGRVVFKIASDGSYSHDLGKTSWITDSYFFNQPKSIINSQFQDNISGRSDYSLNSSLTIKIAPSVYIAPGISAGSQWESLKRKQGTPPEFDISIDSLSPDFSRQYKWLRPGIKFLRNTEKMQLEIGLQAETGKTLNSLNNDSFVTTSHLYFTPDLSWELEYKTGRRLRANFQTLVNVPDVNQLLPVINTSNPLILSSGNRYLKPEISYDLALNWWIFDQFSFTTLLTNINVAYTQDKINWDRNIDESLRQTMSLINVKDDYRVRGGADFTTPLRFLGVKVNANIEETWNRGLNYINGTENLNTNFIHRISLGIENRTKTKFDISVGGSVQITDTKFSIQESLNNRYSDLSFYSDIRYNPSKHFNFQLSSEITQYSSQSFSKSHTIPLLGAEISYYFLKNSRGAFTLQGSDLLNRNTGIERSSELNYLRERRSNMLGRFFMLSFKYKLNKFGTSPGGIDIKIKRR
jgi:hypothetical protein